MSMDIYTPNDTDVIHSTKVDFKKRTIQETVHIVQFDKSLPVVAVALMYNGYSYTAPSSAEVWIRWGKRDHTYVYKKCMVSADRKTVYFDVDYQMTVIHGELNPILELIIGAKSAGSSPIPVVIDRNPIQDDDIESHVEDSTVAELRGEDLRLHQEIASVDARKQDKLTFDTTPRVGSSNPVTSEGIKNAIADAQAHGIYNYKGEVADYAHLPTSGVAIGDVWEAQDTGINWAWNGTSWDNKGTGFKAQLNLVLTPQGYKHATDNDDDRELEVAKALQADEAENAKMAEGIKTDRQIDDPELACPPIVFGTVGGDAEVQNGNNVLEYLEGNSVKYNQLLTNELNTGKGIHNIDFTEFRASNNVFTFTTQSPNSRIGVMDVQLLANHRYLLSFKAKKYSGNGWMGYHRATSTNWWQWHVKELTSNYQELSFFWNTINSDSKMTSTDWPFALSADTSGSPVSGEAKEFMIFDLTAMDIDVNTLEDAIAALKERGIDTSIGYYGYDAGNILSSKSASLISRGENQWDEQVELGNIDKDTGELINSSTTLRSKNPMPVLEGVRYYKSVQFDETPAVGADDFVFTFYDANNNLVPYIQEDSNDAVVYGKSADSVQTRETFVVPKGAKYMRFRTTSNYGTTYLNNVNIYIEWDTPGRPYVAANHQTVQLPNIELRSMPDYSNPGKNIRDIAYQQGGGKRRVGYVANMGAMNFNQVGSSSKFYSADIQSYVLHGDGRYDKVYCGIYLTQNAASLDLLNNKCISIDASGHIQIRDDSCATVEQLKSLLQNVVLLYVLISETDITEEENPGWDELVYTDNYGTLEFTTNPQQVPQVKQPYFIKYTVSLSDFLDSAYERTGGNADEIALQSEVDDILTGKKEVGKSKLANNFDSKLTINDISAWNFRTTAGGEEVGDPAKVKNITGGTIFWNQLVKGVENSSEIYGLTLTKVDSSTLTISGTTTARISVSIIKGDVFQNKVRVQKGHKYILAGMEANTQNIGLILNAYSANNQWVETLVGKQNGKPIVVACDKENDYACTVELVIEGSGVELSKTYTIKPIVHDLTVMLGSTIADYIYSLEQATPGAGVAWFKKYFPKEYYAYSTPTPMHVKISGIRMNRFNQWDEEWETGDINDTTGEPQTDGSRIRSKNFIRVLPLTYYYFRIANQNYRRVFFYDANHNYIGYHGWFNDTDPNNLFAPPANCHYIKFCTYGTYGGTYKGDICINYHWDGERDGEYEEYFTELYPVDAIDLKGIPMLDNEGNLYFDGDKYWSNGTVDENYDIEPDLGSKTWTYAGDGLFYCPLNNSVCEVATLRMLISNGLKVVNQYSAGVVVTDMTVYKGGDNNLYVHNNAYSDPSAFATWLSNVQLLYAKATPTQSQATPFTEIQARDNWGTEEVIDAHEGDVEMPVSVDTDYLPDLKAKLESAPGNPENDGDYVMHRENGENSYAPLNSWLNDNGFQKIEDLSSGIENIAGLTFLSAKAYKSGNLRFLTINLRNETGSTIGSSANLIRVPQELRTGGTLMFTATIESTSNLSTVVSYISWDGYFKLFSQLLNNEYVRLYVVYAVA